jgi:hypothetical protein
MLVANFVHLGNDLPIHLELNISRFKRLFPDIPITLIINSECDVSKVSQYIWKMYIYNREDPELAELFPKLSHDSGFREGFWIKTLERLFAFIEFHKTLDFDTQLLHIESDVLLFPNFPWAKFSKSRLPPLGWCAFSPDHDVASLVYSRNHDSSSFLKKSLIKFLRKDSFVNDMTALNRVAKMYPQETFYFPMDGGGVFTKRDSSKSTRKTTADPKSRYFDEFEGVFDGLAFGMYLTGIDPRNTFGFRLVHHRTNLLNSKSYIQPRQYEYSTDIFGNLWLRNDSFFIPVYCLHIHSKNLKLFGDNWETELRRLVELPNSRKYDGFNFIVFRNLIRDNFENRTLFRYLFNPLRKKVLSFCKRPRFITKG